MTSLQAQRFKEAKLDLLKYLHQMNDLPADLLAAFSLIMPFQISMQALGCWSKSTPLETFVDIQKM